MDKKFPGGRQIERVILELDISCDPQDEASWRQRIASNLRVLSLNIERDRYPEIFRPGVNQVFSKSIDHGSGLMEMESRVWGTEENVK